MGVSSSQTCHSHDQVLEGLPSLQAGAVGSSGPSCKYALRTVRFPVDIPATIKLTHYSPLRHARERHPAKPQNARAVCGRCSPANRSASQVPRLSPRAAPRCADRPQARRDPWLGSEASVFLGTVRAASSLALGSISIIGGGTVWA